MGTCLKNENYIEVVSLDSNVDVLVCLLRLFRLFWPQRTHEGRQSEGSLEKFAEQLLLEATMSRLFVRLCVWNMSPWVVQKDKKVSKRKKAGKSVSVLGSNTGPAQHFLTERMRVEDQLNAINVLKLQRSAWPTGWFYCLTVVKHSNWHWGEACFSVPICRSVQRLTKEFKNTVMH